MFNINSSLVGELRDKQYRDAYVASQIRMSLPIQIRELRKSRDMTQPQLATLSGMTQPRISEIERPGERRLNIETLLRIASAFDVALQIRFVPFEELMDWSEGVDLDHFSVIPFIEELRLAEETAQMQEAYEDAFVAQLGVPIGSGANVYSPDVFVQHSRRREQHNGERSIQRQMDLYVENQPVLLSASEGKKNETLSSVTGPSDRVRGNQRSEPAWTGLLPVVSSNAR